MICSVLIHSLGISLLFFRLKSDYRTSVKMQGGGGRNIPIIDLKSLVKAIILFSCITTPPPPPPLKSILILTEKIKVLFHLIVIVTLRNLTKNAKD